MVDRPRELISGATVRLRPLAASDLPWLRRTLAEPAVAAFWEQGDGTGWIDDLLDSDDVVPHIVEADGRQVGYVQWSEEDDPAYRSASIDLLLAAEGQGRCLGREVVRTLARWLIDERGHHRIEIDPAASNERAIRCYAAVGFRPIGLARQRERAADGTWRDSLLMELLADELR